MSAQTTPVQTHVMAPVPAEQFGRCLTAHGPCIHCDGAADLQPSFAPIAHYHCVHCGQDTVVQVLTLQPVRRDHGR